MSLQGLKARLSHKVLTHHRVAETWAGLRGVGFGWLPTQQSVCAWSLPVANVFGSQSGMRVNRHLSGGQGLSTFNHLLVVRQVLNERAIAVMSRMSDKLTGRDFPAELRNGADHDSIPVQVPPSRQDTVVCSACELHS
jgi:hypothetical protein